jgi:hypothetical protein
VRLALLAFVLAACSPAAVGPTASASTAIATPRTPGTPGVAVTPRTFQTRAGAVDPIAASAQASTQDFAHIQLAASATLVTIHFVNAAPQSITVLDEISGEDLYHVASRLGPGNPVLNQGFVQVFLAPLHRDESQQLVLAYGDCEPVCSGASQVLVVSMNSEHRVVIEQLRLTDLKNAVVDVRGGMLWLWQTDSTLRRFTWDAADQEFVEQ